MNMTEFTTEQQTIIKNTLGMHFTCRAGIIPPITLTNKDYVNELQKSMLSQLSYMNDLISRTNKRTKKYSDYQTKQKRIIDLLNQLEKISKELN